MTGTTTRKLLRLWWLRWKNRRGGIVALEFHGRRGGAATRQGTAPVRRGLSPIFFVLIALIAMPFMQGVSIMFLKETIERHHRVAESLDRLELPTPVRSEHTDSGDDRRGELAHGCAFLVALAFLGVLFTELSQDALSEGGWDVEWLATLPVGLGELFTARFVARTLMSPLSVFWILSLLLAMAFMVGASGWSFVAVAPLFLVLLVLRAALLTVAEAFLHLRVSVARLRNVKGVCAILGTAALFSGIYAKNFVAEAASGLGGGFNVIDWLPFGLIVRALTDGGARGIGWLALALVQAAALALLVLRWIHGLLKDGVIAGGTRESTRRAAPERVVGRSFVSPFVRREWKLLARDFNYLSQTMLVPLVFVGFQLLNMRRDMLVQFSSVAGICAFAFAITAYTYQFSCLRALALEQESLWLLCTFPRPLDAGLRAKAKAWSTLIAIYPLVIVVIGLRHLLADGNLAAFRLADLASVGMLAAGIPLFAYLFTSLGIISGESTAGPEQRRGANLTQLLSLFLIGLYTTSIAQADPWHCLGVTVVTAELNAELWQKAADTLPYLLDPWSPVPRKLSLADGLASILTFLVAQSVFAALFLAVAHFPVGAALFLSYAAAGVVACGISVAGLWRFAGGRIPRLAGGGTARSLALGLAAGLVVGAVGAAAQWAILHFGLAAREELALFTGEHSAAWFTALALVLAPLCEEYLFRGLVFGGLERLWGGPRALLGSALLFAIVHPPLAAVPVFLLGLATGFVYWRGGTLLGSMVTHLVYNGCIVAALHFLQA